MTATPDLLHTDALLASLQGPRQVNGSVLAPSYSSTLSIFGIMVLPPGYGARMDRIALVFLIIAAVLFGLAAFGVVVSRINLVAAGLLAFVLAQLLPPLIH